MVYLRGINEICIVLIWLESIIKMYYSKNRMVVYIFEIEF